MRSAGEVCVEGVFGQRTGQIEYLTGQCQPSFLAQASATITSIVKASDVQTFQRVVTRIVSQATNCTYVLQPNKHPCMLSKPKMHWACHSLSES